MWRVSRAEGVGVGGAAGLGREDERVCRYLGREK